jgi:acetolactate synthase-1/3 small subunit
MILLGDNQTIEQITKQLGKVVRVIEIIDITIYPCSERWLRFVKVSSSSNFNQKLSILWAFFVQKSWIFKISQS